MFKKMLCIVWLSAFTNGILFATNNQQQLDLQSCDKREKELKALQKEIFGIQVKNKPLSFLQANHDKAMAELIILKGLKELIERHKKFLRDVTDAKGTEINGDLGKLNQVRSELKDGIDGMGRMIVMQDMIDQIIDIESDTRLEQIDSPAAFVDLLVERCNSKTPKERAFKFKLCTAITKLPNGSKEWGDISKEDKTAVKAEYEKIHGYSDNLIGMVTGFAQAYIVRHDQAQDDDQAKQKKLAALNAYKDILVADFPEEFSPEKMYHSAVKLDQKLLKASAIDKMKDLDSLIDNGMVQYRTCLGKLRLKAVSVKTTVVGTPETVQQSTPKLEICELSLQYKCNGANHSNCSEEELPKLTMTEAQIQIQEFQEKMSENLTLEINKYTDLVNAAGEAIVDDAKKSGEDSKKMFEKQFKGYLTSLNLFNDRAQMMANILDQDTATTAPKADKIDAMKMFLKGLQNSACLELEINLDDDNYKTSDSAISFIDDCLEKVNLEKDKKTGNIENRITKLESEVMAANENIDLIKNQKDYIDLFELQTHSFKRYQTKCTKIGNTGAGFKKMGRCYINYSGMKLEQNLDTFVSHSGKIIGLMVAEEMKSLPSYIPELRKHTKRMNDACNEERKKRLPELCLDAHNRHVNAMAKSPNEKVRESHKKYDITFTNDGKVIQERRAKTSAMIASSLSRGIVQYGVPTWMDYETNKQQLNYNEALGYNMKVNNYLMDNPSLWGGYSGYYGYTGVYPFSTFNPGFYSPFLSQSYSNGGYQAQYLNAQ
jgi:hypothetical protein